MSPRISFEVFPPRTPEGEDRLRLTLDRLAPLQPSFVSVTCGAGGSGGDATFAVLEGLIARGTVPVAGHLTCVGRTRAEVDAEIMRYWNTGIRHIVALRGDVPGWEGPFEPHPGGYASAVELVTAIRNLGRFEVSVAAYPEPHPDAQSVLHDLHVLDRKAQAGATRAITQFCFETDAIVRLRERVAGAGIPLSIVPGILLATDFGGVSRMAQRCGASIPDWLGERFAGLDDDPQTRKLVGAIVAAAQVDRLRREGFEEFHFYTLNQGDLAPAVCRLLGARPLPERSAA
ncbi:MAG TPA: methylenetetrahydrofolate reductase [Solirubrobacteraceae bacterium]|jgi:methylenetetrahydrofolate reductase (NADPH)|nr:methylenetetrahydrofolate reductase [Solirubrobacteraceae bacterium]